MRIPVMVMLLIAAGANLTIGGNMSDSDTTYIRPPAVAGQFYPGSPSELAKTIATFFHAAPKPSITGRPIAIIAPHAGYIYSGAIAAKAYKILEGEDFSTVIVISPSHTVGFEGIDAFAGEAYTTPFGQVPIDRELTKKIASAKSEIHLSNVGHVVSGQRSEHALEVQLPFLQTTLRNFKLVAIMMGSQDYAICEDLGKAIAEAIKGRDDVLIVASSDLSHFYDSKTAGRLDSVLIEKVGNYDYKGLADALAAHKTEACGGGPIIAAMIAASKLGANKVDITGHGDSGDATGDKSSVVGYMSAIIYSSAEDKVYDLDDSEEESLVDNPASGADFGLSSNDKASLLSTARSSIAAQLYGEEMMIPGKVSDALMTPAGAFVTLTKNGELRGCIGTFSAEVPLYKTVARMALEAAFSDPRFPPVKKEELSDLDIEISVLTPMKKISDPNEVEVGRDGLYIKQGMRAGVLLPQVPVEYGWSRQKFLEQTCLKAGLPPDAWQNSKTELFVFHAEIFGEE